MVAGPEGYRDNGRMARSLRMLRVARVPSEFPWLRLHVLRVEEFYGLGLVLADRRNH